jgi:hypothetical protein
MGDQFIKAVISPSSVGASLLTTANTYTVIQVSGVDYFKVKGYLRKTLLFKAETNDLHFKVEGSLDATEWVSLDTDIAVGVGTNVKKAYPSDTYMGEHWNYLKISIKPQVNDDHGTGTFQFEGASV